MESHQYNNSNFGISLTVNIGQLTEGQLLKNKVVLITGATAGIGKAIAKECLSQGAKVIINGRNKELLDACRLEMGSDCAGICADMADINAFSTILETASAFFGDIDCLVNNAGISLHEGDFMNVTEETWDVQFATNLKSPYFLTQAWLKYYRARKMKSGRIVMMASDTSGMGSSIPYGLTKAGIASLTHGLAKKLITEGIRINAVAPGTTLTAMTDDFVHGEICRDTTQGKRVLFPQEIAEVVVFLLSDLSACLSGNIIGCSESNICFDNVNREQETNP